jgi:hypothetical protein
VVPAVPEPVPPDSEAGDVPWGKAQGGLRMRLSSKRKRFYVGHPIPITVEVENVGDRTVHYHVPQVFINGRIRVLDAGGEAVPYIGGSAQTMNPLLALEPGERRGLQADDLARFHFLARPGRYAARFPGARAWGAWPEAGLETEDPPIPQSNTFQFEVLPEPGGRARPGPRGAASAACPGAMDDIGHALGQMPGAPLRRVGPRAGTPGQLRAQPDGAQAGHGLRDALAHRRAGARRAVGRARRTPCARRVPW